MGALLHCDQGVTNGAATVKSSLSILNMLTVELLYGPAVPLQAAGMPKWEENVCPHKYPQQKYS